MKNRILLILLSAFIITMFLACDENINSSEEVLSPSFVEALSFKSAVIGFNSDDQSTNLQTANHVYMYCYSPAIETFTNRKLKNNQSYIASILDTKVSINYTKDNNILHYIGKSEDNSIFVSVDYNTATKTYDYKNIILLTLTMNNSEVQQLFVTKGENIALDENGDSYGKSEFYTYLGDNDRGTPVIVLGNGEFKTDSKVSAYVTHNMGTINELDENGQEINNDNIFNDDTNVLDNASKIIDYCSNNFDSISLTPFYSLYWFDKINKTFERAPIDDAGDLAASFTFENKSEAQKKISDICDSNWILSD